MNFQKTFLSSLLAVSLSTVGLMSKANAANCDLNGDRCHGTPLSQSEIIKTKFLRDLVADKLLKFEAKEKAEGRDFKVAIIARMGSDLTKFQPLKETNSKGQIISTDQLIQKILASDETSAASKMLDPTAKTSNKVLNHKFKDQSRKIKYSHIGIAVKNAVITGSQGQVLTSATDGEWAVYQLLYSCDDNHESYVFESALSYFFADHMFDYGAQIIVPTQDVQNNIEDILMNKKLKNNFLQKHYNAAALPFSKTEQNSNQWVLETIAAALYEPGKIANRDDAQAVLKETGYFGTRLTPTGMYGFIEAGLVQKIMSNIMPVMCFSSQKTIQNHGIGEIVTALSVEEYMKRLGKVTAVDEVMLSAEDKKLINENFSEVKEKKLQPKPVPRHPLGSH